MAAPMDLSALEADPRLFLYTSLTAGSSHIITATSRMETILKANKIPFQAIDMATDEKARRLWQRRAGKRKLPGLVKEGYVIGDLAEVEEWNEFGELKENIGPVPANNAAPAGGQVGVNIAPPLSVKPSTTPSSSTSQKPLQEAPKPTFDKSKAIALPGAEEIAARNKLSAPSSAKAANAETLASSPSDSKQNKDEAPLVTKNQHAIDHLSAPASRIQSGTATPTQVPQESETSDAHEEEKKTSEDVAVVDKETATTEESKAQEEESKTDDAQEEEKEASEDVPVADKETATTEESETQEVETKDEITASPHGVADDATSTAMAPTAEDESKPLDKKSEDESPAGNDSLNVKHEATIPATSTAEKEDEDEDESKTLDKKSEVHEVAAGVHSLDVKDETTAPAASAPEDEDKDKGQT